MTIQEALDITDEMKPNMMSRWLKLKYLTEIEQLIFEEIIQKHYAGNTVPEPYHPDADPLDIGPGEQMPEPVLREKPVYNGDSDPGTVLLIPDPYSMVYVYWMMTKIDIQNQEDGRYNVDRAHFENSYQTMTDWYNRTHMPIQTNREIRI